jgi:hypothetical protein
MRSKLTVKSKQGSDASFDCETLLELTLQGRCTGSALIWGAWSLPVTGSVKRAIEDLRMVSGTFERDIVIVHSSQLVRCICSLWR